MTLRCPSILEASAMLYAELLGSSWSSSQSRCCANDRGAEFELPLRERITERETSTPFLLSNRSKRARLSSESWVIRSEQLFISLNPSTLRSLQTRRD